MPADQTPWTGRGLPPAASARMEQAAASGVKGSLLSVPDAAALTAVGFEPVGEVMGCVVLQIGWEGYGVPTLVGSLPYNVVTSGGGRRWAGMAPYVTALYQGWDTALRRMMTEAAALGADGVVGVRLTETHLAGSTREFLTLGTAVRGLGRVRATRPFATDLSGADTSKLLHGGWVPTGIAIGISVGLGFSGYGRTASQSGWQPSAWQPTAEVDGYTELVNATRHDARHQFERRARAHGGEAALVSRMRLRVWGSDNPSETGGRAEAIILGTAASAFHRGPAAPTTSLTMLPLGRRRDTNRDPDRDPNRDPKENRR